MLPFNDFGHGITLSDLSQKPVSSKKTPQTPLEEMVAGKNWKEINKVLKTKSKRSQLLSLVFQDFDEEVFEYVFTGGSVTWSDVFNHMSSSSVNKNTPTIFDPLSFRALIKKSLDNSLGCPPAQMSPKSYIEDHIKSLEKRLNQDGIHHKQNMCLNLIGMYEQINTLNKEMYQRVHGDRASYRTTKTWSNQELYVGVLMGFLLSNHLSENREDLLNIIKDTHPNVFRGIKEDPLIAFWFLTNREIETDNKDSLSKMAKLLEDADWVTAFEKLFDYSLSYYYASPGGLSPEKVQIILSNEKIQEKYNTYKKQAIDKNKKRLENINRLFTKSKYNLVDLSDVFKKNCKDDAKNRFKNEEDLDYFFATCADYLRSPFAYTSNFQSSKIITKEDLLSPTAIQNLVGVGYLTGCDIPSPTFETFADFFLSNTERAVTVLRKTSSKPVVDFCLANERIALSILKSSTVENFLGLIDLPEVKAWRSSSGENAGEVFVKRGTVCGLAPLMAMFKSCPEWFDSGEIIKTVKENGMRDKAFAAFEKQTIMRTLKKDDAIKSVMVKNSKTPKRRL